MRVLVLNVGSNSLRFELVTGDGEWGEIQLNGMIEGIGKKPTLTLTQNEKVVCDKSGIDAADHAQAAQQALTQLEKTIGSLEEAIDAVGHRIVHGGAEFSRPELATDQVLDQIGQLEEIAPLHNKGALIVLRAFREQMAKKPHVAVFDTVFHRTIPVAAKTYALPFEVSQRYGIERFGFHGLSHEYMLMRYCEMTGKQRGEAKLVTMHLESGSSVCAIAKGESVETSMGFTPLEGLVMGTRSGDIDPAIMSYLCRKENKSAEQVESMLNKESGLLGLSGRSLDTRDLVPLMDSDERCRLAMDVFSHRLIKYVGAYLTILKGADAIVFGGGIGQNTPLVRRQVGESLAWCGVDWDEEANQRSIEIAARLTKESSRIAAFVIPVEESLMIARKTQERLKQS